MTERFPGAGQPRFADVLTAVAASVTLVTLADGRDDIGTTVSAFCPMSSQPPLVGVCLLADSYPAEVLARLDWFAVTLLAAGQRALAGRFAVAGRPAPGCFSTGFRIARGPHSGALIPDGGLARAGMRGHRANPGR